MSGQKGQAYLEDLASYELTLHGIADGMVCAAKVDTVAVVQRGGDLIEDIEGEIVQPRGQHGGGSGGVSSGA